MTKSEVLNFLFLVDSLIAKGCGPAQASRAAACAWCGFMSPLKRTERRNAAADVEALAQANGRPTFATTNGRDK